MRKFDSWLGAAIGGLLFVFIFGSLFVLGLGDRFSAGLWLAVGVSIVLVGLIGHAFHRTK